MEKRSENFFQKWVQEVKQMKSKSPKHRCFNGVFVKMDLHKFCDASLDFICIIVSLRPESKIGVILSLVIGKCFAPII